MALIDALRRLLGVSEPEANAGARPKKDLPEVAPALIDAPAFRNRKADFMGPEQSAELLQLSSDGLPPLRLIESRGVEWLVEDSTGAVVAVYNRQLRKIGIWGAKIRGVVHQDADAKVGPAELVREPDNEHDANAVAIHVHGARVGYFNKQMAIGLSKALDRGEEFSARVVSASPPRVLACSPRAMEHIMRGLDAIGGSP